MGTGKKSMPMMRLKDEDYEKLEEMAVEETARERKIIPVSEMMKLIIEREYAAFKKRTQKIVKGGDEQGGKKGE